MNTQLNFNFRNGSLEHTPYGCDSNQQSQFDYEEEAMVDESDSLSLFKWLPEDNSQYIINPEFEISPDVVPLEGQHLVAQNLVKTHAAEKWLQDVSNKEVDMCDQSNSENEGSNYTAVVSETLNNGQELTHKHSGSFSLTLVNEPEWKNNSSYSVLQTWEKMKDSIEVGIKMSERNWNSSKDEVTSNKKPNSDESENKIVPPIRCLELSPSMKKTEGKWNLKLFSDILLS